MDKLGLFLRISGVTILFWFLAALVLERYNTITTILIGFLAFVLIVGGHKIPHMISKLFGKNIDRIRNKKRYLKMHGEMFLIPVNEIDIEGFSIEKVVKAVNLYDNSSALTVLLDPSRTHDRSEYFGKTRLKYTKRINKKFIEFYSDWITKQPETILFKLGNQNFIKLYIDKENIKNYYLDIDCLK
jgi:hypothetical protein